MTWNNPPISWSELERTLSGRPNPLAQQGDGSDSPAWTRHREDYLPPDDLTVGPDEIRDPDRGWQDGGGSAYQDTSARRQRRGPRSGPSNADLGANVPYAELHCHSNFSFLDGASHPEELVEEAYRLGLDAIALTDHDGMYGVVRFWQAARELGVATLYGVELSIGLTAPQNGVADPEGRHLLLLARGPSGYSALSSAITAGQMAADAEKGKPVYDLETVAEQVAGHCVVLTGCRKGFVRSALRTDAPMTGYADAAARLDRMVELFGRDNVYVELFDHGLPTDAAANDALAALAVEFGLPTVATTGAHYAKPERSRLAAVLAAIRARRSLDEMDGWLPASAGAHLRSGAEMARLFGRYPGAVRRAAALGVECAFDLDLVAPNLPPFDVPPGHDEASWLRELTLRGAARLYGPREENRQQYHQIEHELKIITELDFPGYFLIVADIIRFCHEHDIYCQGRGSAANSAVCYALGITKVDPVKWKLLFERFLAPERDGPPDIDVDIESDRREEVIQYVYTKHGRERAAQVANVITYRARSAVRDVAKAFGYAPGQQDAWSKQIDRWSSTASTTDDIPPHVVQMANVLGDFPRHLGIHSGGMVLADRPLSEVCPVEWARMENRSVLQWDKDDCAAVKLVKFDLLGLGMLSAVHYAVDLVREFHGVEIDLAHLDLDDQNVYDMLCKADAVGVFQVESRAQLATLPRLKPRSLHDLAVEVALIRPGPIQGGSVHPYIRRANGVDEVTYDHPLCEKALSKTLGVPLFQEQLMQLAIDVGGFTPAEADQLRRAMGSKRSIRKMERLRQRFHEGAAANGVDEETTDRIFDKLVAFANFGFPESHALSFAYLVFASSYLKYYYPAAFCAALLRAQPMGFYSPQSLVADARRHGVTVRGPCVNASLPHTTLEPVSTSDSAPAVRISLAAVRHIGKDLAERIVDDRVHNGPFMSMNDLARRIKLTTPQTEALATAGALSCFEVDRRKALWSAGAVAQDQPRGARRWGAVAGRGAGHVEKIPGSGVGVQSPALPGMDAVDVAVADVWATGLSPDSFPTQFIRKRLDELGVVPANGVLEVEHGTRILIGGAVTHRQRPATARGVTFLNIEDETGMVNVICSRGLWTRHAKIARASPALLVRGVVEHAEHGKVVSVLADHLQALDLRIPAKSRDFR